MTINKANLISLFFLCGITWETLYPTKQIVLYIGVTVLWLIFYLIYSNNRLKKLNILIMPLLIGMLYVHTWRNLNITPIHKLPIKSSFYEGIIIADPDMRADKALLKIRLHDPPTNIQITVPKYPLYNYGDQLSFEGKIEPAEPFNGFNYPLYLERHKVSGIVQRPKNINLISSHQGNPLIAQLYKLKHFTEQQINSLLPEPEASFVSGVLIGSKRSIPEDITASLQKTGTSHLVAISGANITICLGLLLAFFPHLKAHSRLYLVSVSAIFITIFTGASASVIRGACVAILGSYLKFRQRRAWPYSFLIFALTLLVLFNPLLLWADPGFQLSIGAFFGLVIINPFVQNIWLKITKQANINSELLKVFFETLAAYLGTLPVCLYYFDRAPLLGLLTNPLVLWLIPGLTITGFLLIFLSFLPPPINNLIILPTWFIAKSVLKIILICGNL